MKTAMRNLTRPGPLALVFLFAVSPLFSSRCTAFAEGADEATYQELKSAQDELRSEMDAIQREVKRVLVEVQQLKIAAQNPTGRGGRNSTIEDLVGKGAPKRDFPSYHGDPLSLGGPSDKIKVAFFYVSWHDECKKQLPEFQKIYDEYKDRGVDVIAVDLDSSGGSHACTEEESISRYESMKLTMPMHLDRQRKVGIVYRVANVPTVVLMDKLGVFQAYHAGEVDDLGNKVRMQLDQLLAGKSLTGD